MASSLTKLLKRMFFSLLPGKYALPARFHYRKAFGYLEQEFGILNVLVGECSTAIDVGGNFGMYSYALSKLCGHVEYFEPVPACNEWLRDYRAPNVNINVKALSSEAGKAVLHIPYVGGRIQTEFASFNKTFDRVDEIEVETARLDDFGFSGVSFIKIDVEGHELEVLRGGEDTIIRERPVMLIEIEQKHLDFPIDTVFDVLDKLGYDAFNYQKGVFNPIFRDASGCWVFPVEPRCNYIFNPKECPTPWVKDRPA